MISQQFNIQKQKKRILHFAKLQIILTFATAFLKKRHLGINQACFIEVLGHSISANTSDFGSEELGSIPGGPTSQRTCSSVG